MASHNSNMSPRQKMINLMYIVLTAMLALNVSSDVLNGFRQVEEGLVRTTENVAVQNESLYDELTTYYRNIGRMVHESNSRTPTYRLSL